MVTNSNLLGQCRDGGIGRVFISLFDICFKNDLVAAMTPCSYMILQEGANSD